jgi:SAM-dependent methyltransferase
MAGADMESFWDDRAREDAPYFVDNLLEYGSADMERFWAGGEQVVDGVLERVGCAVAGDDDVVEIGCGLGRLTRVLAARARHVAAFDVSSEMLRKAQELLDLENVDWIHGDGTSLAPLEEGSASACFSFVVFQHLPDPAITLGYVREMGRVLRPGGWSAFQISNDPSVHRARAGAAGRLKSLVRKGPRGQDHPAWLGSAVDLAELEQTAAGAGLDVERVEGAGTQFCLVLLRRRV